MKHLPLIVAMMLLMAACAKQGYPTGGPKDTQPPQALGAKPANESRNFDARQFYIEFDEYVVLKNADANVLVSPPMAQKPEYSTKGKGVQVKIKDTLRANTTYLFQFKEAIADFTEGNPLPSYEYVFCTGDQMDTQMLAGTVLRARDGKPWGEPLAVSAFRDGDTIPAFVTRTDKQGNFAFHYIPAGSYRLVSMDDKNKNWMPDSIEASAWDTSLYTSLDSVDSLKMPVLYISVPDRQRQRVLKAEFTSRGRIVINTLLPMKKPMLSGEPLRQSLNAKGDTLNVWLLREQADSTMLVLHDAGLNDTLKLRYRPPSKKSRLNTSQQTKMPLMKALCDGKNAFYDSLMLAFTNPITSMRSGACAEVMHIKDSSTAMLPLEIDSTGLKARIVGKLQSGEEYRIRLRDSIFTDIYGHTSDSLIFRLTPKDYGTLTMIVDNKTESPLLIEVLDAKDTILMCQTLKGSGKVQFTHLPAGEYQLRAVIDSDSNGRWTTGDYLTGRQPEKHLMYEKKLQLREKWEMEEKWTVVPHPITVDRKEARRLPHPISGTLNGGSFIPINQTSE